VTTEKVSKALNSIQNNTIQLAREYRLEVGHLVKLMMKEARALDTQCTQKWYTGKFGIFSLK
jgi:hypothetical protein